MDKNQYNSFTLQACAWLSGRLDLGQDYSWLELAIVDGKYYVSFPPFPSYVMLPLAAVFGQNTPDHAVMLCATLLGSVYAVRLHRLAAHEDHSRVFFPLLLYFASSYLFIGMRGWVWFIAQGMCFTLSLMAIVHALQGQGGISLTCWAAAVGCRPMMVLCLPILLSILISVERRKYPGVPLSALVRRRLYWTAGPCLLAFSYMALNAARFGSIFEFGHSYLPEFTRTQKGQFHPDYFMKNLKMLLRLPKMNREGTLKFYTADGMAFWLVMPVFLSVLAAWLYALIKKRRQHRVSIVLVPAVWIAYTVVILMHKTLGGWQFGNRYMLDMLPYLYYAMLRWKPKSENFTQLNFPILLFGAAISIIGTAATYNNWI